MAVLLLLVAFVCLLVYVVFFNKSKILPEWRESDGFTYTIVCPNCGHRYAIDQALDNTQLRNDWTDLKCYSCRTEIELYVEASYRFKTRKIVDA